jgi:hypothetical protein
MPHAGSRISVANSNARLHCAKRSTANSKFRKGVGSNFGKKLDPTPFSTSDQSFFDALHFAEIAVAGDSVA